MRRPKAGAATWLQYRFGPLKKPELVFPADTQGSLEQFSLSERPFIDGPATTLRFSNAGTDYEVFTQERGAGGGVNVGSKAVTTIACSGKVTAAWGDLKAVVKSATPDCRQVGIAYANRTMADARGHMDGMQQGELAEGVGELCAGWSEEGRRCVATAGLPCAGLTDAQKKALKDLHVTVVPP